MRDKIKSILKLLEELFFPAICEGCGEVGCYLCDRCVAQQISIRKSQQCHVCKRNMKEGLVHKKCVSGTNLDGVFIAADYSKFIENYLGDIKYEFYYKMIDDLVKVFQKVFEKESIFHKILEDSVLTFVPLHTRRKRWRGFNQAELIAKQLSDLWRIDSAKLLERRRKTKSQVGLKRKERLENLKGAFEIGDGEIAKWLNGRSVIIVDDVMTSGGTLEECALELKKAGVGKVYGLVVARG
ncbi:MAG: phosphoribosyltransferase family protein [Patescibacteria group bacterium]|nr:hypothetical protein [Patescibacteria group bacterium]